MEKVPNVLFLNGSERARGNTDYIVERAADTVLSRGAKAVQIYLRDYRIEACGPCGNCNTRTERCGIEDDVESIIARMREADAIIYAAPVHGFGMAELMQRFIERAGVGFMRFDRPLANKVGSAIVTGRRYNHEHVL